MMEMLRALASRGPDSAGVALIGDETTGGARNDLVVWITPDDARVANRLAPLGQVIATERFGATLRLRFSPNPGVAPHEIEAALEATRGELEVLCIGRQLELVKQVGSPEGLVADYGVSRWVGPLAIGHTRMSTESRIDLSHSQPFWVHGVLDLATVHNGHVTNYHRLRREYEQEGVRFHTDNDSEVIGVYLRNRLEVGRSLPEALADSISDLDGAFNYLVASDLGLGVVRDRFGFKPLVMAESNDFVAVATEEQALRRALPGQYHVFEPAPGSALFFPLPVPVLLPSGA
jgi:glutamine phosphoribosylpyrophosphate amidotransferase